MILLGKKKWPLHFTFYFLLFTFIVASCAKQGYPSGGPRDAAPPKAVGSKPLNELPLYKDYDFAKAGKEKDALTAKFAGL